MKLLVVDDDEANRMVMCELIEILDHVAFAAGTRFEALAQMRDEQPDAAFLDLRLNGDSGLDVARVRREEETTQGLPRITIIGLTGEATQEAREACAHVGMDDCMFKPVQLDQLEACIGRLGGSR